MANQFKGVLLCSDLDGTLALGRDIPRRNIDALHHFMEEGGLFSVSTGRTADYLLTLKDLPYNAPFICGNGTEIFDPETMQSIYRMTLPPSYQEAADYALSNYKQIGGVAFYPAFDRNNDASSFTPASDTGFGYNTKEPFDYKADVGDLPILKVVFGFGQDAETCSACKADLEEKFPQLFFNRSWPFGLEMLAKGTHKGVCANILKKRFNASVLVCIGDFENDLPMLEAADLAFTPENGWSVLKEMADGVLCNCADGALGDLIDRLPVFLKNLRTK